jgi:hypothetical protein
MKSRLLAHHLAIQKLILTKTGFCSSLSMAFAAVLATGMTKSIQFSSPLDSLPLVTTLASTWALFAIPPIPMVHH